MGLRADLRRESCVVGENGTTTHLDAAKIRILLNASILVQSVRAVGLPESGRWRRVQGVLLRSWSVSVVILLQAGELMIGARITHWVVQLRAMLSLANGRLSMLVDRW